MKLRISVVAGTLLFALAACGPGNAETAINEAAATATTLVPAGTEATVASAAEDPTVAAIAGEVEAALADPELQSTLDQAFTTLNDEVTLTQGEDLGFDALAGITDITNYRMTVIEAPAGAAVTPNTVIKEASDGNVSLNPDEYEQYFTTAGDYRVRLDITSAGDRTAAHEFTIAVP